MVLTICVCVFVCLSACYKSYTNLSWFLRYTFDIRNLYLRSAVSVLHEYDKLQFILQTNNINHYICHAHLRDFHRVIFVANGSSTLSLFFLHSLENMFHLFSDAIDDILTRESWPRTCGMGVVNTSSHTSHPLVAMFPYGSCPQGAACVPII